MFISVYHSNTNGLQHLSNWNVTYSPELNSEVFSLIPINDEGLLQSAAVLFSVLSPGNPAASQIIR